MAVSLTTDVGIDCIEDPNQGGFAKFYSLANALTLNSPL